MCSSIQLERQDSLNLKLQSPFSRNFLFIAVCLRKLAVIVCVNRWQELSASIFELHLVPEHSAPLCASVPPIHVIDCLLSSISFQFVIILILEKYSPFVLKCFSDSCIEPALYFSYTVIVYFNYIVLLLLCILRNHGNN